MQKQKIIKMTYLIAILKRKIINQFLFLIINMAIIIINIIKNLKEIKIQKKAINIKKIIIKTKY